MILPRSNAPTFVTKDFVDIPNIFEIRNIPTMVLRNDVKPSVSVGPNQLVNTLLISFVNVPSYPNIAVATQFAMFLKKSSANSPILSIDFVILHIFAKKSPSCQPSKSFVKLSINFFRSSIVSMKKLKVAGRVYFLNQSTKGVINSIILKNNSFILVRNFFVFSHSFFISPTLRFLPSAKAVIIPKNHIKYVLILSQTFFIPSHILSRFCIIQSFNPIQPDENFSPNFSNIFLSSFLVSDSFSTVFIPSCALISLVFLVSSTISLVCSFVCFSISLVCLSVFSFRSSRNPCSSLTTAANPSLLSFACMSPIAQPSAPLDISKPPEDFCCPSSPTPLGSGGVPPLLGGFFIF